MFYGDFWCDQKNTRMKSGLCLYFDSFTISRESEG